jgi:hypothetical protein
MDAIILNDESKIMEVGYGRKDRRSRSIQKNRYGLRDTGYGFKKGDTGYGIRKGDTAWNDE